MKTAITAVYFSFFLFVPHVLAAEAAEGGVSLTKVLVISVLVVLGIIAIDELYKLLHKPKDVVSIPLARPEPAAKGRSGTASLLRQKLEKLPLGFLDREKNFDEIAKIVEEEAHQVTDSLRREYAAKYQAVVQEKQKEVEFVKKEFEEVKEKYQTVEKKYQETESEKKTTEAVVKSIAEGLVVVNQKGEVLLMNPSAEKLLGVQKDKKIGQSIMDDLGDEILVSLSKQGGDSAQKVVEYKSKSENVKKVIRSSSAVIQNENGQTVGMVNVLTDITKQKEVDEMKDRFLSNVTHELRTPIVAMQKAILILLSDSAGALNDTQLNFLNMVSRNLTQLSRLVEDLLDMAKLESGKMRFKFTPSVLEDVIREACEPLQTWAKSKEIKIILHAEKGLPEVSLDPDKITQVLNNLISNAIKFTPSGGKIEVTSARVDEGSVRVSVADTGVGIAKENLQKLFRRFEQFGSTQSIGGTGLGLSIVKEIVERHDGRISAESEEGKGTQFTFILPIEQKKSPTGTGGN